MIFLIYLYLLIKFTFEYLMPIHMCVSPWFPTVWCIWGHRHSSRCWPTFLLCIHTKRIQSQRRDANQTKNFARKTWDKIWLTARHVSPSRATAFTWICSTALSLEFKYFNFAATFAWWEPIKTCDQIWWKPCHGRARSRCWSLNKYLYNIMYNITAKSCVCLRIILLTHKRWAFRRLSLFHNR